MNLDIVEIALDYMTDGFAFEKLASEVMRSEGYHDIRLLGGVNDLGQDAIQDRFYYREGRSRVVFQYTLEDYLAGKLRDTVAKLDQNGVSYTELIIVTPLKLSSERQHNLKQIAREEFDVTLQIFERKTLVNRLSDLSNGIFVRHFPSVEEQMKVVKFSTLTFEEGDGKLEMAMLKVSIALVFGTAASSVRKTIFDHVVLASVMQANATGLKLSDISARLAHDMGCDPFPESQINAALQRLESSGLLTVEKGSYNLTTKATATIGGAIAEANSLTNSFISDIVEKVVNESRLRISQEERGRLERNAKDVLAELFRLLGIELANQFQERNIPSPLYLEASQRILAMAKRQTRGNIGELLVAALAEAIQHPNVEQARVLAGWARTYLGAAVMNLDPTLREFQTTRLKNKIFILDTDFVLSCIVSENPICQVSRTIVQELHNLGCRLIIPEAVIEECAVHAELAPVS
jgi:hypothetical protein